MATRPNVLFLFTDDQRFDTLAALGNPDVRTPNMDRLVETGVAFTRAFICGSTVPAVCICSRATLLTGRPLWRAPKDLPPDFATWPEVMREAGYETFGIGKWHNGVPSFARGFAGGAKIFFGGMSDHRAVPVYDFHESGKYPEEERYIGKEFSSDLFANAAVRFLEEYDGAKPFFLYVAYTAPHDPRTPPDAWARAYDADALPTPASFMPEHPFDNGELEIRDERLLPWPRTPEAVRREIAAYYGMISHADETLGRVLDALERSGHAENTIILFAGDNGLAVGRHGLLGKQSLYEHSLRVPLVVRAPGVGRPGARCDALCYLHDLFPTVCDLVDLPKPETVESRSLAALVRDPEARVHEAIFAAYRDVQRAVRTDRWKLIWYSGVRKVQVFDCREDPQELADLSSDPEHAETRADLAARLAAWQDEAGDGAPRVPVEGS
jgi:arylsulfatase A-like enzyme